VNRSDRALIRDLKIVRQQLAELSASQGRKRPEPRHLHSLIGRAIFIRYLEDRQILLPEYFEKIAARRKEWTILVSKTPPKPALEPRLSELRFLRVLQNKDFTYALFDQMAHDFNGDTFPIEQEERDLIQQAHLDKLRGFLLGSASSQEELFFFAYRFDIIPIELISTIYEKFYNERTSKGRNQGSHYTPPALVEFILSHTLTPEVLATKPRVLDAACGSGIFLVESFRRIVRHLCGQQGGRRVSPSQLREILRDHIAGIDINEEAVRVAAFSLYLAFLHYQAPREINDERRLPYLKWVPGEERKQREKEKPGAQFFDVLLHANSFEVMGNKYPPDITQRFGRASAAVVVGNPPWGYPKRDDLDGQKAMAEIGKWCNAKEGRPIGDKELSQAFIHLTQALLQEGGKAGLLVSSGVFFKHHKNSREFRRAWLLSARLEHVVNFAHVRHIFFSASQREARGISPFVSVVFEKTPRAPPIDSRFQYWSAKRTEMVENTQSVVLNRGDMHWLSQRDCLENEKLWKIYWWGGHRDEALVRAIERFPALSELPKHLPEVEVLTAQGFKEANKALTADWLEKYRELPTEAFVRYGPIDTKRLLDVPKKVERRGVEDVYHGRRLLFGRGIREGGVITTRFETRKLCFRNSIQGARLKGFQPWQELVITAIFWSSLARYYYFTTTGSWGLWHDEIHKENIEEMPIVFPKKASLRDRIVRIVQELQSLDLRPDGLELGGADAQRRLPALERQLDAAIFDLYELNATERDLVHEMCTVGLDFFYRNQKSDALREVVRPELNIGTLADVSQAKNGLSAYLRIFLESWNAELAPDGEVVWRVVSPPSRAPLLAVAFATHDKHMPRPEVTEDDAEAWHRVLGNLEQSSRVHANSSRIFIDTFFRQVSESEILFIERNEQRFWTRTAAREDVESTLTYLMNREEIAMARKMKVSSVQLRARQLWATREAKCISIIERALALLRQILDLPGTEIELNRHLYFCLLAASRELYPEDEIAPISECNNQPDPDDEARAKREQKRPDFQWIYLDRYESDPQRSSKQFVVECKRLGKAVRSDWVLNVNYTNHGIGRFREPEWAYAKRAPSGAMVGYWQSMEASEVLSETNEGCLKKAFPNLMLVGDWNSGGASRLDHTFNRPFEISPFRLHHLWVDLRIR
jgi:N-6 DNA Methylase